MESGKNGGQEREECEETSSNRENTRGIGVETAIGRVEEAGGVKDNQMDKNRDVNGIRIGQERRTKDDLTNDDDCL